MKIEEQVLSIEQMKHLQELGVDTSDASMVWNCCDNKWYLLINNELTQGIARVMKGTVSCLVPTYTIGDLINKLPPEINDSVLMIFADAKTVSYTSWAAYSLDSDMVAFDYNGSTLMKALHGLLCWVAENHIELIK